jgi:hypothetical protein
MLWCTCIVNGDDTLSVQSSEGVRTSSGQTLFSQYIFAILDFKVSTLPHINKGTIPLTGVLLINTYFETFQN